MFVSSIIDQSQITIGINIPSPPKTVIQKMIYFNFDISH